jgi:hypothetical protein
MITGTTVLAREWQVVHPPIPGAVTVEQLRERLSDAADTLRRLPKPKGLERSLQSPWPDTLREWLSYGYDRTQVRRAVPTPQAIDRLDEVLEWIGPNYLTTVQRMVLWAREGEHMRWRRIEFLDAQINRGNPRKTRQLQNIKADAEHRILSRLNGTPARMRLSFPGGGSS